MTDRDLIDDPERDGPPIVLDAKSELLFFKSTAHLEAYVEPVDVRSGEYGPCWDATGQLLELFVVSERGPRRLVGPTEVVRVRRAADQSNHLPELHLALLRHLDLVGLEPEMPVTNDTYDLFAFALEHAGWS